MKDEAEEVAGERLRRRRAQKQRPATSVACLSSPPSLPELRLIDSEIDRDRFDVGRILELYGLLLLLDDAAVAVLKG